MSVPNRAIALVVAAAAVSAGAVYHARHRAHAAETVPALLSRVPSSASVLLYADLARLRASPLWARFESAGPPPWVDPDFARFVRSTGFDYSRDLDRLVLAVRPDSPTLNLAIAEGRFDREKISSYARQTGTVERLQGTEVYLFSNHTPGKKEIALAFLENHRVALGDPASLATVLASHGPDSLDPEMRERVSRVGSSALFAVGRMRSWPVEIAPGGLRSEQLTNLIRTLRWFSLAARPEGDRLVVAAEGECDTAENARQLAGTLDGLRMLARAWLADPKARQRLNPGTAAQLDQLLEEIAISCQGQRARLTAELTPKILDLAGGKAPASH